MSSDPLAAAAAADAAAQPLDTSPMALMTKALRCDSAVVDLAKSLAQAQEALGVLRTSGKLADLFASRADEVGLLRTQLDGTMSANKQLHSELERTKKSQAQLQAQVPALQSEVQRLTLLCQQHEHETNRHNQRMQTLMLQHTQVQERAAAAESQVEAMAARLQEAERSISQAEDRMKAADASQTENMNELIRHKQMIQALKRDKTDTFQKFIKFSQQLNHQAQSILDPTSAAGMARMHAAQQFTDAATAQQAAAQRSSQQQQQQRPAISTPRVDDVGNGVAPRTWTVATVSDWLLRLELGQYVPLFRTHNIDGAALLRLQDETLQQLGVGAPLHRRKLLKNIKRLGVAAGGGADAAVSGSGIKAASALSNRGKSKRGKGRKT